MRVAYVSAGAAGMYCGSCLHDNTLARALIAAGHEVALIPIYTPMRTDEASVSLGRVYYGAVNAYLRSRSPLYRKIPPALTRLLDRPRFLSFITRGASSTDAATLGDLTISVLEGETGPHRAELDRLVAWLRDDYRPEIVHLTNSMLLGLAAPLRRALRAPVVVSLQGEDLFLEGLTPRHRGRVVQLLRQKARDADLFVATGTWYAGAMADLLALPPGRIAVVPLGIEAEGFAPPPQPGPGRPFAVGYLARIAPEKGLHLLADAFRSVASAAPPGSVRLHVAGYLGPAHRRYLDEVRGRIRSWGLEGAFEHAGEVDRQGKIEFLRSLDLFVSAAIYPDPKGLPVMEALAAGVPVLVPDHGTFPETISRFGGGRLYGPRDAAGLASAIEEMRRDAAASRALGERGRAAVLREGSARAMAEATLGAYALALAPGERR